MTGDLAGQVQDYLRLRRALGFKLVFPGQVLPQFVAYLHAAGADTITVDLAVAWAALPQGVLPISVSHRLGAVRGFAKYLHTIDPRTQVPPPGIFTSRTPRRDPNLFSDADVTALLHAAGQLTPPQRAATYQALLGLLVVSGIRIGEALGLRRGDVDLTAGILTIRDGKFGRSRLVPLHPSSTAALRSYAAGRDKYLPTTESVAFFLLPGGTALHYGSVQRVFRELTTTTGLRTATVHPRIHELRHRFAVGTVIGWYRSGADVAGNMAMLSHYLGHINPAGTYWYLSASPELMQLAAARLADRREAAQQ